MVVLIINEKTDQQRSSEITSSEKNEKIEIFYAKQQQ